MEFVDAFIETALSNILKLAGMICGALIVWLLTKVKAWVIAKVGQTNYNRAVEVAKGIYIYLEDEIAEVKKTGIQKKDEMEALLLKQFPSLTKIELDAINKTVWESFNHKYSNGSKLLSTASVEEDLNEESSNISSIPFVEDLDD